MKGRVIHAASTFGVFLGLLLLVTPSEFSRYGCLVSLISFVAYVLSDFGDDDDDWRYLDG